MSVFDLNAVLDEAVDRHPFRPAVSCDGFETDFERLDESVEWLREELVARGVQPRARIGVCITDGWEFVLAFHVLARLDAVMVPIDPFDDVSLRGAGELDLHHIIFHREQDAVLEEAVALISGEAFCPMFDVAEVFTLVVVSVDSPLHVEGGLFLNELGFRFRSSVEVGARTAALSVGLELGPESRVMVCGPWSCPCAVLLLLACATSGSCVQVIQEPRGYGGVLESVAVVVGGSGGAPQSLGRDAIY
ncbi:AMP-binding protein [Williamsia sp.]|uniref:AMP-binding protein n=1 Tax=Williamsia sp. TaxID=1872085 RepID=UPI002F95A819